MVFPSCSVSTLYCCGKKRDHGGCIKTSPRFLGKLKSPGVGISHSHLLEMIWKYFRNVNKNVPPQKESKDKEPKVARLSKEQKKVKANANLKQALKKEFTRSFNAYIKQSAKIEWDKVPGVTKPTSRQLIWKDLWQADMGYVLRDYFFKDDPQGTQYGYLPKMAMALKGMMCQVMAASFCERVNSCAGNVVDERNSSLGVDQIDKMTVLSMNKKFMEFMRREYPEVVTKGT